MSNEDKIHKDLDIPKASVMLKFADLLSRHTKISLEGAVELMHIMLVDLGDTDYTSLEAIAEYARAVKAKGMDEAHRGLLIAMRRVINNKACLIESTNSMPEPE